MILCIFIDFPTIPHRGPPYINRQWPKNQPPNETVEKPLVRKMFIKISHNRLKKCQNVAKMLCGTPRTRHFSAFLSHFSKIIVEKRLIRQSQRLALPGWWAGRENAILTEPTSSHANCLKTRRLPPVGCTLC